MNISSFSFSFIFTINTVVTNHLELFHIKYFVGQMPEHKTLGHNRDGDKVKKYDQGVTRIYKNLQEKESTSLLFAITTQQHD